MKPRTIAPILATVLGVAALAGVAAWGPWRGDDGESVAGLIRRLKGGPGPPRREAATALGLVVGPGAADAAAALIEATRDPDAEVRARSARAIGTLLRLNPARPRIVDAASALTAALGDPEPKVRASAALGLLAIGGEASGMLSAVIDGLRGDDAPLRSESAALLASLAIRGASDLRRLVGLLDDPEELVRGAARASLTRPGLDLAPEVALPVLSTALRTGSPAVRAVAATMLGRSVVRVSAARDTLMAVLKDRDPGVRTAAAAALGAFSEDGLARAALRVATDDPDLRVRATASASLAVGRRAARSEALAALRAALAADPARRGLAAEVAADPARATPRLIDALRDRSPRVRAAAARCLGEVASRPDDVPRAISALTLALSDRDPSVRRASAAALARRGPSASASLDALRQAVRDADRGVSAEALVAVQSLDRPVPRR